MPFKYNLTQLKLKPHFDSVERFEFYASAGNRMHLGDWSYRLSVSARKLDSDSAGFYEMHLGRFSTELDFIYCMPKSIKK